MRTGNLGTASYAPAAVPTDPNALQGYLTNELANIASAIALLALGHVDTVNVAPTKPREGDIRLADGTHWDPGAGQGVYAYYAGAWAKLG